MPQKALDNNATGINISLLGNRSDEFSSLMHIHKDMQILVGSSGILEVVHNSKKHNLRVGDVIIIKRRTPHISRAILPFTSTISITIGAKYLFSPTFENISESLALALTESDKEFIYLRREDKTTEEIVSVITKMHEESIKKEKNHPLFIDGYMKILLGTLYRHEVIPNPLDNCDPLSIKKLYQAFEYIDNNYSHEISLEEIATTLGMNREYFCRLFKKTINMTFVDYTNLTRTNRAVELLISSQLSMAEISENLGFSSISYFSRVLKNITNKTPASFQKLKIFDK